MIIAVCEDEKAYFDLIQERVRAFFKEKEINVKVEGFSDASILLKKTGDQNIYDLILMDIKMKHSDGMEAAVTLRERNINTPIIFVTGNETRASQGYRVDALDYVVKNELEERLPEALERYCEKQGQKALVVSVKGAEQSDGNAIIRLEDLLWAESDGRGSRLVTINENIETPVSIGHIALQLPKQSFIEVYKAVFVNVREIKRVGNDKIVMSNDMELPLSRRKKTAVLGAIMNYVKGIK